MYPWYLSRFVPQFASILPLAIHSGNMIVRYWTLDIHVLHGCCPIVYWFEALNPLDTGSWQYTHQSYSNRRLFRTCKHTHSRRFNSKLVQNPGSLVGYLLKSSQQSLGKSRFVHLARAKRSGISGRLQHAIETGSTKEKTGFKHPVSWIWCFKGWQFSCCLSIVFNGLLDFVI